jgi:hypothetical protein
VAAISWRKQRRLRRRRRRGGNQLQPSSGVGGYRRALALTAYQRDGGKAIAGLGIAAGSS